MGKIFRTKPLDLRVACAVAVALIPSAFLYAAEEAATGAVQTEGVDAATLAQSINTEVDKLAPTSSVADYEASILFVISQASHTDEVILAALDIVSARPDLPETLKAAIENVRRSITKKTLTPGTGALGDGISSSFSSPSIGLGGGSTNYTG